MDNDAPIVTATADRSRDGNLSTTLVGTATDDGIPETNELTVGWSTVSAPAGASVIYGNAASLTTTVTGTAPGDYVFRFRATDGALTTERDVALQLTEKATTAEFGAVASITTSGTSSWENHSRVNEATTPASSSPGTGNGWGNWGQPANGTSVATAAWIRYQWQSPVRLQSTEIYWYDDNGGVRMPRPDTYTLEYSNDGTTWTPVTLTGTSTYAGALTRNAYNRLEFEPIEASQLRIRITGVQTGGAGTGVLRWRVNGESVASVDAPVIIRTVVGEIPTLPTELDVVYASGKRGSMPFSWQPITAEQVAETNVEPFLVYGTNNAYGLIAQAQIYVRPEDSEGGISIQGAQQFEQRVAVGELPWLPPRALVSFNDGSRDNRAVGIEWDFDESIVQTPGVYTVHGDLVLPSYISTAGTTSTTLTLTVGDDMAPTITHSPAASVTAAVGEEVTLSAAATGIPLPTVKWESSTDHGATWNAIAGATDDDYTFEATAGQNDTLVRATYANGLGSVSTEPTTITVTRAALIAPTDLTITGTSVVVTDDTAYTPGPFTLEWTSTSPDGSLAGFVVLDDGQQIGDAVAASARSVELNLSGLSHSLQVKAVAVDALVIGGDKTSDALSVVVDTTAPAVTIVAPSNPTQATSWKKVSGTIADTASGPERVTVKLVEHRGNSYYWYDGNSWTKGSSLANATANAKSIHPTITAGKWSVPVNDLKTGTLRITYSGTDAVGNTSGPVTVSYAVVK